ncbi:predicted protein [Plenodomus lingam JN3]|uniref:Uncharacterized protein n=1 Tax=Leptosphaeria maculans (strain JN3 / isolate v23.1.3 / race Av1-4-5-6-7-8) TaxID=985895 RepID=E5A7R2_LEPMJ|nr:predicted protein [Plenodomus lingam JN3]CBX99657.1 predicted protein [Plenodomus lingam JN3]
MGPLSKTMETRRLHNADMKHMHKGLDAHLINDIWSWLKHEFEGAVGRFLYPIIMSGRLNATEETQVRQLEPVSRLWRRDWNLQETAPMGHEPIQCGEKWAYQHDQCPACMLSRIGSDGGVLFALFAGMVGRFNTRSLTHAEAGGSADAWEKTRSKRIRFVKYWLRANRDGDAAVFTAGMLGMKMKRMRREWGEEQSRVRRQLPPVQPSLGGNSSQSRDGLHLHDVKVGPVPRPADFKRYSPASALGFDIPPSPLPSSPRPARVNTEVRFPVRYSPPTLETSAPAIRQSSTEHLRPAPLRPRRPKPPPAHQDPLVPSIRVPSQDAPIWDLSDRSDPPELQYPASVGTLTDKNHRNDSVLSSLPPSNRQPSSSIPARPSSPVSTRTIASYNGRASSRPLDSSHFADPFDSAIYATFFSDAVDAHDASTLPKPKHGSMYEAFGDGNWDAGRFERVDEDRGEDEDEVEVEDGLDRAARLLRPKVGRGETGETGWEVLY